jgi:mono/diheme cytochrome c family protein
MDSGARGECRVANARHLPGPALPPRAHPRAIRARQDAVVDIIANGKRPMPAYGGIKFKKLRISDEEIRGIADYVLKQADAGWPAQ